MKRVQPITPSEIPEAKVRELPDFVIKAFNAMIASHMSGGRAKFTQDNVLAKIMDLSGVTDRQVIFDRGWLDAEDVYQAAGWRVEYEEPDYNEDYQPNFTFTVNR